MFKGSRRRAAPLQPLTKETADPNAATAAASAFMRREPTQSLSSAAAAAALRARPTTPTNVAEMPSKRVRRRNSSLSSLTSRDRGRKGELQRSPSVGSMIERTFRSPSPGRGPVPGPQDVPPVPNMPIPEHVIGTKTTVQQKGTITQTQPFRTASQRVKAGQQGSSWFGAATARDPVNGRADSMLDSATSPSEPRPGSVSPSINFSYPRARIPSGGGSPSQSISDQDLVYDANSRRMVSRGELLAMSITVGDLLDKPAKKKKKKKKHDVSRTGPHLSNDALEITKVGPSIKTQTSSPPVPPVLSERTQGPAIERGGESIAHEAAPISPSVMPAPTELPSLVEEIQFSELEERKDKGNAQTEAMEEPLSDVRGWGSGMPRDFVGGPKSTTAYLRVQSESPSRSAHFALPTDQLVVKHEPPPRSLSPRKSAMKLSNSARGVSPAPSNDDSEASGFSPSQSGKEDLVTARKKSVRVSWDDRNTVVVGESAQHPETEPPVIPSPQGKKQWHSTVGKYPKKEMTSVDEAETMSPRPALPLFGSVREKKAKEPEERPLVRPHEKVWPPKPTLHSLSQTSASRTSKGLPQSSGSVIGIIPSQEQSSKHEANISKYREPLPTAVTFFEASEHGSDDPLSSDEELDVGQNLKADDLVLSVGTRGLSPDSDTYTNHRDDNLTGYSSPVPTISVSQPSLQPQGYDNVGVTDQYTIVPGSFPKDEEVSTILKPNTIIGETTLTTPAQPMESTGIKLDVEMADIEEEDEVSEGDSVYSDAYEDLSVVDGFMSLDAVLVCPPEMKASTTRSNATKNSSLSETQSRKPLQASDDWENAKAYWKSLSSDKRRQLEMEALQEADEGTLEGTSIITNRDGSTVKKSEIGPEFQMYNGQDHQIKVRTVASENATQETSNNGLLQEAEANLPALSSMGSQPSMQVNELVNEPSPPDSNVQGKIGATKKLESSNSPLQSANGGQGVRQQLQYANHTMTPGEVGKMRTSLRSDTPSRMEPGILGRSLKSADLPSSSYLPPSLGESDQKCQRNHPADSSGSLLTAGGGTSMGPRLRRRGSDSSESSFTRTRTGAGPRHGLRMSLRPNLHEPASPSDGDKGSSRFSLRSLSPTGSALRPNSVSSMPSSRPQIGNRMRHSLRHNSSHSEPPRPRVTGFDRTASKKSKKSRSSSRFVDSSDEDDDHPTLFRSRFRDSSDEEEAVLPNSRHYGLPKSLRGKPSGPAIETAVGVGPFTMQNGSLHNDGSFMPRQHVTSSKGLRGAPNVPTLQRSGSGRGTLMSPSSSSLNGTGGLTSLPTPSRRGSFMFILRRKRDSAGKIARGISESAARRDTRLARSTEQLTMIRTNSLRKREPSWPLPDNNDADDGKGNSGGDNREAIQQAHAIDKHLPSASGTPGADSSLQPGFIGRRSTSQSNAGLSSAPNNGTPVQHNRKKKFGSLRKMFGLND